jgi:hypothetical protein
MEIWVTMHSHNAIYLGLPAAILAMIFSGGCGAKKGKSYAPELDAAAVAKAAMAQYDTNKDGKISGAELDKAASLKSNLEKIDLDGDKAITADEITARIRLWQTDKWLRCRSMINCTVYRNNKPLANAEVKLAPEKFLGDKLKAAKGTTTFNGGVTLSIPDLAPGDPPGVDPGFYRVEITKSGEKIPAKYNTDTTLGLDSSTDNPAVISGLRFNLNY